MTTTSVFLLGATGYLGGSVLTELEKEGCAITCLVRPGKEQLVEKRKVKVVTGDFSSLALIERTAFEHDVAINAADSDDLELTKAINRGLVKGKQNGKKGVLVHVSGTQVIESLPSGKLEEDWPIFNDSNLEQIKGIDDLAAHREIDNEITRADLAGEITASIVCPGLIYGVGSGPDKIISSLIPDSVKRGLRFGRVPVGGKGTNIWSDVHVEDVSQLIVLSMNHNLEGPSPAGYARFYFGENGENDKVSLSERIARILQKAGKISSSDILHVPIADSRAPGWANKTTVRCKGTRGRKELGWKPRHTLDDQELEEDVHAILKELQ